MGIFVNPGNAGFASVRAARYVDKSGLIAEVNKTIGTSQKLTCVSRPRRFGKTFAAQMLCAYYDCTCDSHTLFDDLAIARDPSYEAHLNAYNVLCIDMTQMMRDSGDEELLSYIKRRVSEDLRQEYPNARPDESLSIALVNAAQSSGRQFVAVFDEWDAPIRELPATAQSYIEFLRTLFKSITTTNRAFAAAYMTGILPIRKDKGQSAVSDFWEYSAILPGPFAPYMGFLEDEVRVLCEEARLDFNKMQKWYDGYEFGEVKSVYNPYAVMRAIGSGSYRSYWRKSSAVDMLLTYIDLDFEGLQDDIVRLMAGDELEVETSGFNNDPALICSRDDALTLMIHLGYLTFEEEFDDHGWVHIPNTEVRTEFEKVLRQAKHPELMRLVHASDELMEHTLSLDGDAVAAAIARVHDSNYAPKFYNDEQALRHTVKMAYIASIDRFARVEELPSGHGLADIVFIPRRRSPLPALVIELKWNQSPDGAIAQIKDRDYGALPAEVAGEVLLVGITYDAKTKKHACQIETIEL